MRRTPILAAVVFVSVHFVPIARSESRASVHPGLPTLASLDSLLPWQRSLGQADSIRVSELERRIQELRGQARYAEAVEPAEEAWRIRRTVQGEDHWQTRDAERLVATLRRVAALPRESQTRLGEVDRSDDELRRLFEEGDFEGAAVLVRRGISVRREILGEDHVEVAVALADLATILWTIGDAARAQPLFRRVLELNRSLLGTEHPDVARAMNNWAVVLVSQGEYEAAKELFQAALAMNRRLLGDRHPHVIADMGNLAVVLQNGRQLDEAESLLREVVALGRQVHRSEVSLRLHDLNNLIWLLLSRRDVAGADEYLREAWALCDSLPEGDAQRARTLGLEAIGRRLKGDLEEAESMFRRALASDLERYGAVHRSVVADYYRLAETLHMQGRYAEAETSWVAVRDLFERTRQLAGLQGLSRVRFSELWSPYEHLAACLARLRRPRAAWEQLEAHFARGLLDELVARFTGSEEARDGVAREGERAHSVAAQREAVASAAPDGVPSAKAERRAELGRLEDELEARGGTVSPVTLEELQGMLRPDQAMLSWVDIPGEAGPADPPAEHWACVVRHSGDPVWVPLQGSGPGGTWTADDDSLPQRLRRLLQAPRLWPKDTALEEMCRRLSAQRLAPVERLLEGVRHLLVVPGEWMSALPIEALTDDFTVSYVPSATVFVWLCSKAKESMGSGGLFAMGDPMPSAIQVTGGPEASSGKMIGSETLANLPGTRREIQSIARQFELRGANPVTVLVGPDATERRLCEAAATGELGRFGYLHFATHALMNNRVPLSSALVLSAEDPWDAFALAVQGEEVYDGLVTADQILRTWRIGARLVTLSACETGLGKESRGEGFVGFSQAFFVAGARSLLVSLWKVEDRATMLLMTRFYENTLGTHGDLRVVGTDSFPPESPLPMAEALREAKEWVRGLTWDDLQAMDVQPQGVASRGLVPVEEPVVKEGDHPFAHPHFWAAFVLSGDPR